MELKARAADLDRARRIAREIATMDLGVQEQTDTYFRCVSGRLKLRQGGHVPAQLVWYRREDERGPRVSDYRIVPISNPETLKGALEAALGVWCIVKKRREIYLYQNVRIHLDEVEKLGTFLEFEAVLSHGIDEEAGRAQLAHLRERFAIAPADLVAASYSDLLADASSAAHRPSAENGSQL